MKCKICDLYWKGDECASDCDKSILIHGFKGEVLEVRWEKGGYIYRENGPGRISFFPNGKMSCIDYYRGYELHREGGPAHSLFYEDGSTCFVEYYYNGKLHNMDGYASILYKSDGSIDTANYYLDNQIISASSPEEFIIESIHKC